MASEQLRSSIDMWGLMHSCCSVISRGCHLGVIVGMYTKSECAMQSLPIQSVTTVCQHSPCFKQSLAANPVAAYLVVMW
jgi:uncharacterized protein (UPF0261 family)